MVIRNQWSNTNKIFCGVPGRPGEIAFTGDLGSIVSDVCIEIIKML